MSFFELAFDVGARAELPGGEDAVGVDGEVVRDVDAVFCARAFLREGTGQANLVESACFAFVEDLVEHVGDRAGAAADGLLGALDAAGE
jgi:hypothetical protein